jgi:uncharacterized protein DUF4062
MLRGGRTASTPRKTVKMKGIERKYQVFVSSTYEDLKEERQEVMQALLELDYIPSGMKLFPAADEDQWTLIKEVIDECDYLRSYSCRSVGSIGPDEVGYTEKEYCYVLEKGKPIVAFLHKNPDSLERQKTETDDNRYEKWCEFRELAKKEMCKFWTTPQAQPRPAASARWGLLRSVPTRSARLHYPPEPPTRGPRLPSLD